MRRLISGCLILALSGAAGTAISAQSVGGAVKKAGKATADAGKQVGETTKDVGKATVSTTKTGANKTKDAVTGKVGAKCADGSWQSADTKSAAAAECRSHGGVKK
jgi:hypothetical protein